MKLSKRASQILKNLERDNSFIYGGFCINSCHTAGHIDSDDYEAIAELINKGYIESLTMSFGAKRVFSIKKGIRNDQTR
jgi:hypothetical protein